MMNIKAQGIVPVMLTPFTPDNRIDWKGLERLVEWYIANGADTLFAVCQSSEMQKLSLAERVELSKKVVSLAAGRLPVISSGHISEGRDDQRAELVAMAETGIDALVLVSNRLDTSNAGTEAFRSSLDAILSWLPSDLALGLYECPAPYRRLLTDDEFKLCRDTGRFVTLKDVSCDLETVKRRVELSGDSGFAIVNANAAIAAAAMRAGSKGFSGCSPISTPTCTLGFTSTLSKTVICAANLKSSWHYQQWQSRWAIRVLPRFGTSASARLRASIRV